MTASLADGLIVGPDGRPTCWWHGGDPLYTAYHDTEWGRPTADDRALFEKLCLEGFQAGLSWLTILRKRDGFRRAFAEFAPARVARFTDEDVARLLADTGIVRHRGKIEAAINNAKRALDIAGEAGSLAAFLWRFAPEPGARGTPAAKRDIPSSTSESASLSKALRKRGFAFVGPTTVYAFMQSMGFVNDHIAGCVMRADCETAQAAFTRPG